LRAQIDESLWPTIDAVGQAQRQRALGLPNLGPTTNLYNVFAGQIRASYTFDLFGVERFANSALAAQVDAQSYQFDAARRAVAANVVISAINAASLRAGDPIPNAWWRWPMPMCRSCSGGWPGGGLQ
jgi:outer membrane protein TolC